MDKLKEAQERLLELTDGVGTHESVSVPWGDALFCLEEMAHAEQRERFLLSLLGRSHNIHHKTVGVFISEKDEAHSEICSIMRDIRAVIGPEEDTS